MRLLSKAGLAGSALWVVQLASSRHSVRVVNCLVIEAPFDDRHTVAGHSPCFSRKYSAEDQGFFIQLGLRLKARGFRRPARAR